MDKGDVSRPVKESEEEWGWKKWMARVETSGQADKIITTECVRAFIKVRKKALSWNLDVVLYVAYI